MKKKIITLLAAALMLTSLAACGNSSATAEEPTSPVETSAQTTPDSLSAAEPAEGFRVMIVGSGSPAYEVDRGQPSTLVQYKDKYFLVDCGNGTVDTLLENGLPVKKITNMLFTHQHFDHNADFWDVFMGGSVVANPRPTFTMIGPDVTELFTATTEYYKADIDQRIKGMKLTNDAAIYGTTLMEITENTTFELDGVTITTMKLPHGLDNYAYKFEAGGQTVVVSGDFLNIPELADFAKDSDIFVVDAMLTSTFDYIPVAEARAGLKKTLEVSHATAEQVHTIIANANAKKTVLTHLGGSSGIEDTASAVSELGYTGELIAAEDGLIIEP